MQEHIIRAGGANFDREVLQSGLAVLVDYWAEWCAPCKMIAPILDELAVQYQGKLRIAKENIEAEPKIAQRYAVRSAPTLMLFRNGRVQAQKTGALSRSQLSTFIAVNL